MTISIFIGLVRGLQDMVRPKESRANVNTQILMAFSGGKPVASDIIHVSGISLTKMLGKTFVQVYDNNQT